MFIGHLGAGFAATRVAPRASLGLLVAAAQLPDLLWAGFLLAGLERVRVDPGHTVLTPLAFEAYPFSHSLLADLGWGAALALLYRAWTRDGRGAAWAGALVVSHWVLDLAVHRPDLPLYPGGGPLLGLGLWNHPAAAVGLEVALFAGGLGVYLRQPAGRRPGRTLALWGLVALVLAAYAGSVMGPPPPSWRAVALVDLAGWLLLPWLAWVDRDREVAPPVR